MAVREPPTETPPCRMTEEEFVAWCDEDTRAEFLDGEVIILSPESRQDEIIRGRVFRLLSEFVEYHRLGEVYGPNMTARLRVGRRRIPDLLFVSTEKLQQFRPNHFEGAPDLAMEIVSPDSAARDWHDKFLEYEASGVREYWVIDPQPQRLDAYVLNEAGRYELLPFDGAYRSSVVPGFFLRPEWIWQMPHISTFDLLRELGLRFQQPQGAPQ